MKMYIGLILLLGIISQAAIADNAYPIITFTCDTTNNVIKIKNEVKWGDEGKNFQYSSEEGTYNPWSWVGIEDINAKERKIFPNNKTELSCQLSNGLYKVILEPKIFNTNYLGKCGKKISTMVTVFRGGALLLDRKPLEEFCHGNSPIIRGVKVFGKTGKVKLYRIAKHRFY